MPYFVGDFLDDLERELARQRRVASREVDRADALAQLRTRALSVAADLKRPITVEDVFSSAKDERERAELSALADRITREQEPGGNPASKGKGEQAKASLSDESLQDRLVDYPTTTKEQADGG